MASIPSLHPLPPASGDPIPLDRIPFWIGAGARCDLRVYVPGVADRHVGILGREDGLWIASAEGTARVNGTSFRGSVRLQAGDVVEIAPGASYRFDDGVTLTPSAAAAPEPSAPVPARSKPKKRRRHRRSNLPWTAGLAITLIVVLIVVTGVVLYRAVTQHGPSAARLSDADAAFFDQLLQQAYDHIERGSTLLEYGAADAALKEFAVGVNVLATSRLRDHPYVKPRIEALEASIASIYKERRLQVPGAYQEARTSTILPLASLRAVLSAAQFASAFAAVQQAFFQRFHDSVVVTGRDHAEHLSLYGRGGALDIRTKSMTRLQIDFVITRCRAAGMRVKDFSHDSILQFQIQSALRAGLPGRAGTGSHIHLDRFADRIDAFTVR